LCQPIQRGAAEAEDTAEAGAGGIAAQGKAKHREARYFGARTAPKILPFLIARGKDFAARGWGPPKRCKDCRDARNADGGGGSRRRW